MRLRSPHFVWIVFTALAFTSCQRGVGLFSVKSAPLSDASTGPGLHSISVWERPPQTEAAEGYLLPDQRSTPLYTLREDYRVAPGGESWAFVVTGVDHPLTVVIYGNDSKIVASRGVSAASRDIPLDIVIAVFIPGSTHVTSFQIVDNGPSASETVRLVGVSTAPPVNVSPVGVTDSDGLIVIGTGSSNIVWGNEEQESLTWSVSPDPEFWDQSEPVEVAYRYEPSVDGISYDSGQPLVSSARLTVGSAELELLLRPGLHRVVVYPMIYDTIASNVRVNSIADGLEVLGIGPIGTFDPLTPLPADLGTVFDYPADLWRTRAFEIFRWTLFPEVLIMDTLNYAVQSRFFKRLAFFVEKEGYRGHIPPDVEIAELHGYNAHNYNAQGLAEFFNSAQRGGIELHDEERLLRRILEQAGIILRAEDVFETGKGGILSISQESRQTPGLRHLLLTHEGYHGVFYASEEYGEQIGELWRLLSDGERRYWRLLLDGMQYDIADPYLVENEFQAYLLQQPSDSAAWYFGVRSADRLRVWKPQERAWLNQFLIQNEGTFLRQALAANKRLFLLTGLIGGEIFGLKLANQ